MTERVTNTRSKLLREINDIILENGGMTRAKYEEVKNLLLAPGINVRYIIDAGLDLGQIEWKNDILIPTKK